MNSFRKLLATALLLLSGAALFAAGRSQDVGSPNIQPSNDPDVQEKNAIKLLIWWDKEVFKTQNVTGAKLVQQDNEISLVAKVSTDENILNAIEQEVKNVLLTNGFTLVKRDQSDIGNVYYSFKGTTFALNCDAGNHKNEVYSNPNIQLFMSDQHLDHPQNYFPQRYVHKIIVCVKDKSGNETIVAQNDERLLTLAHGSWWGKPDQEKCQLLPYFNRNKLNQIKRALKVRPRLSAAKREKLDKALAEAGLMKFKIPEDKLKDAAEVQIKFVHTAKGGKGNAEEEILASVPVPANMFSNLQSQKNAQEESDKALADLFSEFCRNYYKMVQFTPSYKYNRIKKAGEVTLTVTPDKRGFVRLVRSLESQLSNRGIKVKKLKPGYGYDNYLNSDEFGIGVIGMWYSGKLPDKAEVIQKNVDKNWKSYNIEVTFKNASGEVLQKSSYDLPRELKIQFSKGAYSRGFNHIRVPELHRLQGSIVFPVVFDIPEDAKAVSSVECTVVEKKGN